MGLPTGSSRHVSSASRPMTVSSSSYCARMRVRRATGVADWSILYWFVTLRKLLPVDASLDGSRSRSDRSKFLPAVVDHKVQNCRYIDRIDVDLHGSSAVRMDLIRALNGHPSDDVAVCAQCCGSV